MDSAMKYLSIIGSIVLAGSLLTSCTRDHAPQLHAQPVHVSASQHDTIVRGSTAPAAPVQLTYHVPADIAANQPTTIDVALNTHLDYGVMQVEIAGHEGVTMLCDTRYRFDLAAKSERPIALSLRVLPADQSERFLAVLVTVETEMGAMARSFRIDLAPPAATQSETAPVSNNAPRIQQ